MSQRIHGIHLPIPQDETQDVFSRKVATLAVVLAALVLLFAAVAVVVPGSNSIVETTDVASLAATNPELMAAGRYAKETAKRSEAAFLYANPELMAARRHAESAGMKGEDSFLAANPELIAVRHQGASKAAYSDSDKYADLAANPELMIFLRYLSAGDVD